MIQVIPQFENQIISVEFAKKTWEFAFWSIPLWEWARNIIQDRRLASRMNWDAVSLSKFNGYQWTDFVHEPFTAKAMWDAQVFFPSLFLPVINLFCLSKSKLPNPDGKPLCITLFADKTQLSSFGSEKGYPIMAQLCQLPHEIRNGCGLGATQVVGWLPIVSSLNSHPAFEAYSDIQVDPHQTLSEKKRADFKRAVWHSSFRALLRSIASYSRVGCWVTCGDGVDRLLYPMVLILSADYEEQCV